MPTDDRLLAHLTEILTLQLRALGRANLQAWVQQCDALGGALLTLRAPRPGHAVVEVGYQSGNFPV